MLVRFREEFDLPVGEVYPYFRSPRDWTRLYGSFGEVKDEGGGWFSVPLRRFPFPLVARMTADEPDERVAWEFRGFWKGHAEMTFRPSERGVVVEGYEEISVRPLSVLSPVVERFVLEKKFRALWSAGWKRLRRMAPAS
jgi:hypothetical protein